MPDRRPPAEPGHEDPSAHAPDVPVTGDVGSRLAERRREIEAKMASIQAHSVNAVGGIGFGKRVGEGTNIAVERIVDVAIHDSLQIELDTVRRAEEKQHGDGAGRCDVCAEPIPPERLEALPWAVTCVACAN